MCVCVFSVWWKADNKNGNPHFPQQKIMSKIEKNKGLLYKHNFQKYASKDLRQILEIAH